MKTFAQGIHPKYNKEKTQGKAIRELHLPRKVIIPLHQHTGAACEPLVQVGEMVYEGQKIGDVAKFISAPVHASIAGKVTRIDKMPHPCGVNVFSVVIEQSDEGTRRAEPLQEHTLEELSPEDIRKTVREAGIVGLGGAAFPTHVKITPPEGKKIDTIVVNGCECEPYITADHRIMLERAEEMVYGAVAVAKATEAKKIVIGIENNKLDAIERVKSVARKYQPSLIKIVKLETKYPQGGEKMLLKAVLGREVPSKGLPLDVGAVVINVGTAVAIAAAIKSSTPLIKRVVTVTGSAVVNPQNVMVRIGTTFKEVIEQCGGLSDDAAKVIMGGPMMGLTQPSLDVPIVKATSAILVLKQKDIIKESVYPCVKCAKCVDHCPMYLIPSRLAAFSEKGKFSEFEDWGGQDCIECGCCAYVCPAAIPLVHWIKLGKLKLRKMK